MPAVILCEKPAQARDLAKALGGTTGKGTGWIDCPAGRLTWAIGHLVDTAPPEAYDQRYARWRMEDLPIVPQEWILEPREGVKDQLKAAIATLRIATVIYIATDAGREGELIAYEVIERAGVKVPIKRLWFSAQDEESLRKAWAHPKEASETVRLYHAAQVRQRADWLFGMNLTRAATLVYGGGKGVLPYGRVQTPTLALIVQRDREIESFKSREYFELNAHVRSGPHGVTMHYAPSEDERRIWKREDAQALLASLQNAEGTMRVTRQAKRQSPPRPYALSDLQGDANSRFGYSAQATLEHAQALYERHKAITYPRSDCNYLPDEMARDVPTMLRFLIQTQCVPNHPDLAKPLLRRAYFDSSKLSDHHAIVPTPIRAPIELMSEGERNVFALIAMRFAQLLLPDYEYEATIMEMAVNGVHLEARGRAPRIKGWKDLDRTATEEEQEDGDQKELAPIRDGSPGKISSVVVMQKATQAPKRYTERTLLADMKNVHRHVDEPVLKRTLKRTSGLGTEATRASHIEGIKKREFAVLDGRGTPPSITSTTSGRELIDRFPRVLTLAGLTAAWEDLLESVAVGTCTREDALAALTAHMRKQLALVVKSRPPPESPAPAPQLASSIAADNPLTPKRSAQSSVRADARGRSAPAGAAPPCPRCSSPMKWRINRKSGSGFWGCTRYPDCTATVDPAASETRSPRETYGRPPDCPTCSKRMRLIQGSRGPFFGCSGFPACRTSVDAATGDAQDGALGPAGRSSASAPRPSFRRFG